MESNHKQDARFVKARDSPKRNGDSISHASVQVMPGLDDVFNGADTICSGEFLDLSLLTPQHGGVAAFRELLHAVSKGPLRIPDRRTMKRAIEGKAEGVKKELGGQH
ncbi:unnamed protein product [Discosporangium mesarthrocarpum]